MKMRKYLELNQGVIVQVAVSTAQEVVFVPFLGVNTIGSADVVPLVQALAVYVGSVMPAAVAAA